MSAHPSTRPSPTSKDPMGVRPRIDHSFGFNRASGEAHFLTKRDLLCPSPTSWPREGICCSTWGPEGKTRRFPTRSSADSNGSAISPEWPALHSSPPAHGSSRQAPMPQDPRSATPPARRRLCPAAGEIGRRGDANRAPRRRGEHPDNGGARRRQRDARIRHDRPRPRRALGTHSTPTFPSR